jgi:glycosyltransferase involved in cell wall biosynthesis
MFESVKDQIKYERREGMESDFVDTLDGRTNVTDDGWLTPVPVEKALEADIWVPHSKIPDKIKPHWPEKKVVFVLHGPSEHMLLTEWVTNRKVAAFDSHIQVLSKYHATVVLNKHEWDVMKLYDSLNRLHYIPNSIDLERYQADIPAWEYENHPAIGSFDVPRLEKLPAHILWAMPKIQKKIPTAKLNIFSLSLETIGAWRDYICKSAKRQLKEKSCENIQLGSRRLMPFMKGIDMGFNNNFSGIASRVTMEMMALGVPVVSYGGKYTKYHAKIFDLNSITRQVVRCWKDLCKEGSTLKADTLKYANENFSRAKEVKKYIKLYEKVLEKK